MKICFLLLFIAIKCEVDVYLEEEENRKQIEALKEEKESIDKDKNIIWNWLNFWKNPVSEEDAKKMKTGDFNLKMNIKVNALPNSDGELIDTHFRLPKTFNACQQIETKLNLLNNLTDYYFSYNNEDGEMISKEYPFNYIRVLNHKIFGAMRQLNEEEDDIKKYITIFKTTINEIQAPNFSVQHFYYEDDRYKKVEQMIMLKEDPSLAIYFDDYVKQREAIVQVASEWNLYVQEMDEHLNDLFEDSSLILQIYEEKISQMEQIESVEDNTLKKLRNLIRNKNDILDFLLLIQNTVKKFEGIKPALDVILGKSQFIVNDLESKNIHEKVEDIIREDELK